MSLFVSLYDLAISLLTARPDSGFGPLTNHHYETQEQAEKILRAAILQRTMPGEKPTTPWGILRIFMRNLVNRAQSPMAPNEMVDILNDIAIRTPTFDQRRDLLVQAVANNPRLTESLGVFLDPQRAPSNVPGGYLDWLCDRITHYSGMSVANIDPNRVLSDLRCVATNQNTKIPNMAIALAANLFADCGIRAVGKPDLHVLPTIIGLIGRQLAPEACIKEVIRIAKEEAPLVAAADGFDWLDGGLFPRDVDRVIYLIGSDNFLLDGNRKKLAAPQRRQKMLEVLRSLGAS